MGDESRPHHNFVIWMAFSPVKHLRALPTLGFWARGLARGLARGVVRGVILSSIILCEGCGDQPLIEGRRDNQPEKPPEYLIEQMGGPTRVYHSNEGYWVYISANTIGHDHRGRECFFESGTYISVSHTEIELDEWIEISSLSPIDYCHGSQYFIIPVEHVELRYPDGSSGGIGGYPEINSDYVPTRESGEMNTMESFSHEYVHWHRSSLPKLEGAPASVPVTHLVFPLSQRPLDDYTIEGRGFGASRNSGHRKHAANDLLEYSGETVYAVTSGEVLDYYYFYDGTHAVVVDHKDFVVRYGEVASLAQGVKVGSEVNTGEPLAPVGRLRSSGYSMLHFEKYSGVEEHTGEQLSGSLTDWRNPPYYRRADLVNPTPLLRYLESSLP